MYYGQADQDKFVLNILKEKIRGVFLEIGSGNPISINNTYVLEKLYYWKGIMVERDPVYLPLYQYFRKNSIHIINDATNIDYRYAFERHNMPLAIDYLQIDLEPGDGSTIRTLEILDSQILDVYKFATVTFEHDIYNTSADNKIFEITRLKSREIFKKRGYVCVFEDVGAYEDWYVHPDLVDMNYVTNLIENNKDNYEYHPITEKSIHWKKIQYANDS